MWHVIFDFGRLFLSSAFCSIAVKLLDDYLDQEIDAVCDGQNWINRLGQGAIAYSLPLLAASIVLCPYVGFSLFLAAWAIGMFHHLMVIYPSGLRGWQESIIAIGLGIYLVGWTEMMSALLLTGAVQLFDDIVDLKIDCASRTRNMAQRLGTVPCGAACLICLLLAKILVGNSTFWPIAGGIATVYVLAACTGGARHA